MTNVRARTPLTTPGILDRLMGYDAFERHQAVRIFLGTGCQGRVLDVGGLAGGLRRFLPEASIVALNVDGTGDVHYDGDTFPFADQAFEVVVSLDTLEHVPLNARDRLVHECTRVAQRAIVIAAPYGSPGHSSYEARLDRLYRGVRGEFHKWLHEHVVQGLPRPGEIFGYCELLSACGFTAKVYYSGNYEWQCRSMERSLTLAQHFGTVRQLTGAVDLLTNAFAWPAVAFAETPAETTNRFYLYGERV